MVLLSKSLHGAGKSYFLHGAADVLVGGGAFHVGFFVLKVNLRRCYASNGANGFFSRKSAMIAIHAFDVISFHNVVFYCFVMIMFVKN